MKILLILPAGDSVRVTLEQRVVPDRAMLRFSVLPLTVVAALTPPGHEVRIVDENVEPLDFDTDCDLVGISFMTALAPRAYEIAARFRAYGKRVIGGGYHATLCTADALPHFDALVVGDAEGAWPQVLEDASARRLRRVYHGTRNPDAAPLRTQPPRRELLGPNGRHYVTINAVQTSRGCRHGCRYCSITAFHQRSTRHRPIEDVTAEVGSFDGDFIFVDDNIAADREYARSLFTALQATGKRWVSQCSLEVADDPEFLRLMHRAGCRGLFIGIETVSAENLAAMGKQFNDTSRYAERIRRVRRAGIGIVAGIIVGLDHDDAGVFERTLQFLQRTGIDAVQVNILTPLPGTPLFAEMDAAGRVTDRDWSHYDFRHVVFQPARISAVQLQAGADWLYAQFYRLDRILARFVRGVFATGFMPAYLGLRLGLTYRYDNRREGIIGWVSKTAAPTETWAAAQAAEAVRVR